jgi:26S proteasome regulatory subunit N9
MVDGSAAPAVADPRAAAMATVKAALAEKKAEVDALSGLMDTCVHSAYYELATEYYKQAGPPEQYYKHALMLLAYTPLESMGADRAVQLATDMSLAALAGDGVYNFGEVLATPIVAALEGTPNAWLGEMLRIFNRGDVEAFAQL